VGNNGGSNTEDIEIVSVNNSQILITRNLTAGWNKVSLGKSRTTLVVFVWFYYETREARIASSFE
jgi:hypothetical protein